MNSLTIAKLNFYKMLLKYNNSNEINKNQQVYKITFSNRYSATQYKFFENYYVQIANQVYLSETQMETYLSVNKNKINILNGEIKTFFFFFIKVLILI